MECLIFFETPQSSVGAPKKFESSLLFSFYINQFLSFEQDFQPIS